MSTEASLMLVPQGILTDRLTLFFAELKSKLQADFSGAEGLSLIQWFPDQECLSLQLYEILQDAVDSFEELAISPSSFVLEDSSLRLYLDSQWLNNVSKNLGGLLSDRPHVAVQGAPFYWEVLSGLSASSHATIRHVMDSFDWDFSSQWSVTLVYRKIKAGITTFSKLPVPLATGGFSTFNRQIEVETSQSAPAASVSVVVTPALNAIESPPNESDRKSAAAAAAGTYWPASSSPTRATTPASKSPNKRLSLPVVLPPPAAERQLLVMRHGERMDYCVRDWADRFVAQTPSDGSAVWCPSDLNAPAKFPLLRPLEELSHDPPLTRCGEFQAFVTGQELGRTVPVLSAVIASPVLRSVTTAQFALRGFRDVNPAGCANARIVIDPSLFEWIGYHPKRPHFITADEFARDFGFTDVVPPAASDVVEPLPEGREKLGDYAARVSRTFARHLSRHPRGSLLFVGHAGSPVLAELFTRCGGVEEEAKRQVTWGWYGPKENETAFCQLRRWCWEEGSPSSSPALSPSSSPSSSSSSSSSSAAAAAATPPLAACLLASPRPAAAAAAAVESGTAAGLLTPSESLTSLSGLAVGLEGESAPPSRTASPMPTAAAQLPQTAGGRWKEGSSIHFRHTSIVGTGL